MIDQLQEVSLRALGSNPAIRVHGPTIEFASPAPLPYTSLTHEYHEEAWVEAWKKPAKTLGKGGGLFILVRDPDKVPGRPSRRRPWTGVSVRVPSRRESMPASRWTSVNADLGYSALHVAVKPGTATVQVRYRKAGIQSMAVPVCHGWQTQILLMLPPSPGPAGGDRPLLADASVFMRSLESGAGFDPEQARLTELARQGLAQARTPIAADDLQQMLHGKFSNPMLGIFGAWFVLSRPKLDRALLDLVLENLERLIPTHPDVQALRIAARHGSHSLAAASYRFSSPPMLLRSWEEIVKASASEPGLIEPGSLADRIGHGLVGGGPWLVWSPRRTTERSLQPAEDAPLEVKRSAKPLSLMEQLDQMRKNLEAIQVKVGVPPSRRPASRQKPERSIKLTQLQESLVAGFGQVRIDPEQIEDLVERVRVPRSTIEASLQDLDRKLSY